MSLSEAGDANRATRSFTSRPLGGLLLTQTEQYVWLLLPGENYISSKNTCAVAVAVGGMIAVEICLYVDVVFLFLQAVERDGWKGCGQRYVEWLVLIGGNETG